MGTGGVRAGDVGAGGVGTGIDHRILSALRARGADPRVAGAARALSWAGEHGALWLAAGLAGAAVDRPRHRAWLRATALTAGAHLASMGVKRIVRRPRPAHVEPLVRTAGRHSFPSSHATSAAAAAVAYGTLGAYAVPPLAVAMCLSRLVVGVHYPSDVAAGAVLGALTARMGARWMQDGAHGVHSVHSGRGGAHD
ncbi:phosphatase PAP2 family protein [Streptomyces sp. NBC_01275]|uniref:phosphatase PAP2 family protein n=1 Tax=Streptomyces sp. NBC_01275 TaxID=2903807 RepID=UPI00225BE7FD|nr:phosphatase PAP2 family protein [Streptomyces sp. NBC_01275]MCX4764508.1 phosphatase PAP2 family protein [Streptomyces sp. NBC_01275]